MSDIYSDRAKELRVECSECKTTWIGFQLPMEVSEFVRVSNALTCPKCSADSRRIRILTTPRRFGFGDDR